MEFRDAIGNNWSNKQKAAAYLVVAAVLDGWMVRPEKYQDKNGKELNKLVISKLVSNPDRTQLKPITICTRTNNALYAFELAKGYEIVGYYGGLDTTEVIDNFDDESSYPAVGKKLCERLVQRKVKYKDIEAVGKASAIRNQVFMLNDEMVDKSGLDPKLIEEINQTIMQNTADAYDEIGSSL